jgi:rhamnulokinase
MNQSAYLAFDLGAESGRAILGTIREGVLDLHEVHRFANTMVRLPDGYHWDTPALWANLMIGLRNAGTYCRENDLHLRSLGVDTWGVDFGLIGESGGLLGLPFAYRDERNQAAMEQVIEQLGAERIYGTTGIQFMPFNTLFQLAAFAKSEPGVLKLAKRLLFTPDLLHYFFTGEMVNEFSIASTSAMLDRRSGEWARDLLDELNIPTQMLGKIVPAGSVIGTLLPHVAEEAGVSAEIQVITPAGHDTGSAIAAVPVDTTLHGDGNERGGWCYISSGTWSLMGVELDEPILSEAARNASFTNEGGVDGTTRFLTNIMGLWLVQECRRAYEKQGETYDYAELTRLAEEAEPLVTLIDPDHGPFLHPGGMLEKIADFAEKSDQAVPESVGAYVRCCLESLALTYHHTLSHLENLLGRKISTIHIVGGGGQNRLLNQMTADATGRQVVVGPFEGTAAGNILVQAMGCGDVAGLTGIRRIITASFEPEVFEPHDSVSWIAAYQKWQKLRRK